MRHVRLLLAAILWSALASPGGALAADAPLADAPLARGPALEEADAHGLRAGDWLLRARIAGLFPVDETSSVELIGGRIDTPEMILPDVQTAYFLTDHISVEGQVGAIRTRPRILGSLLGDFQVGTIWSLAAAASIQYHFLPKARFNPYAGIGVAHSRPISIDPAPGVSDFEVSSQTSLMLQVGADYHLTGNWFGNAVAKYLFVPEQTYRSQDGRFTSDSDMVFAGVGIGYRF